MPDRDADTLPARDPGEGMARMAQRLAAAGPRTRQRVMERQGFSRGVAPDPGGGRWPRLAAGERPAVSAGEDDAVAGGAGMFDRVTLRHAAWLGVAAVLGFGAVAVGQSPRLASMVREAGQRADPGFGAEAPPAGAVQAAAPPPASPPVSPNIQAPRVQGAGALAAVPRQAQRRRKRPQAAAIAARARPAAPVHQAARYQLPRWLTEQTPPAAPRGVIMSPPPGVLAMPQSYAGRYP